METGAVYHQNKNRAPPLTFSHLEEQKHLLNMNPPEASELLREKLLQESRKQQQEELDSNRAAYDDAIAVADRNQNLTRVEYGAALADAFRICQSADANAEKEHRKRVEALDAAVEEEKAIEPRKISICELIEDLNSELAARPFEAQREEDKEASQIRWLYLLAEVEKKDIDTTGLDNIDDVIKDRKMFLEIQEKLQAAAEVQFGGLVLAMINAGLAVDGLQYERYYERDIQNRFTINDKVYRSIAPAKQLRLSNRRKSFVTSYLRRGEVYQKVLDGNRKNFDGRWYYRRITGPFKRYFTIQEAYLDGWVKEIVVSTSKRSQKLRESPIPASEASYTDADVDDLTDPSLKEAGEDDESTLDKLAGTSAEGVEKGRRRESNHLKKIEREVQKALQASSTSLATSHPSDANDIRTASPHNIPKPPAKAPQPNQSKKALQPTPAPSAYSGKTQTKNYKSVPASTNESSKVQKADTSRKHQIDSDSEASQLEPASKRMKFEELESYEPCLENGLTIADNVHRSKARPETFNSIRGSWIITSYVYPGEVQSSAGLAIITLGRSIYYLRTSGFFVGQYTKQEKLWDGWVKEMVLSDI